MVKINYFHIGHVGPMMSKEFSNKGEAQNYLEKNKEWINLTTASVSEK